MASTSFTNKVVGIFTNSTSVDSLISELHNRGFEKSDISILAKNRDVEEGTVVTHSTATYPRTEVRNPLITERPVVEREPYYSGVPPMDPLILSQEHLNQDVNITHDRLDEKLEVKEEKIAEQKDPQAMIKGATTGGAIGIIGGLAALLVPGVGPVLAAGPIAAAVTAIAGGAAVGATAGTLVGLFQDEGIPNDRSDFYNQQFNRGRIMVMVHTEEGLASLAREIMNKYHPETVDSF